MNVGLEITSKITSLAYGGDGITKHESITGFVSGALPGELIKSKIEEIKKKFFRARLLEIIEPSPFRLFPPCKYFGRCGGCIYQHLSYEKQLEAKSAQLSNLLLRSAKITGPKISAIIPSPRLFNYRNQLSLKLKQLQNGIQLGFLGFDNKTFIPIEKCLIAKDPINEKIHEIKKELSKGAKIRNISGEIIIKCGADNTVDYAFAESVSPRGQYKLLHEEIGDKIYYFSLASFFQTNPYILPSLLLELKTALNLDNDTALFDLYSGTGLFSIYLSSYIKNAYGIETNKNAVRLANKSAEANKIKNCRFFSGKTEDIFTNIYDQYKGRKNIFIVDPPRQGLCKETLDIFKNTHADQLIYISCEPSILARDLPYLSNAGYGIKEIILADMFPQTKHMETLAILKK